MAKQRPKFMPLGKAVLCELKSPAKSVIVLQGEQGKKMMRCYVAAMGPEAAENAKFKVGDEVMFRADAGGNAWNNEGQESIMLETYEDVLAVIERSDLDVPSGLVTP